MECLYNGNAPFDLVKKFTSICTGLENMAVWTQCFSENNKKLLESFCAQGAASYVALRSVNNSPHDAWRQATRKEIS